MMFLTYFYRPPHHRSGATDRLISRWILHGWSRASLLTIAVVLLRVISASLLGNTLPPGFSEEVIRGQTVGGGWDYAAGVQFGDNGRMYVWERTGRVWFQEYGGTTWRLLIDLREEVGAWGDHGMLGFALDPNFRVNGHFYLMYVVDRHHLLNFGKPGYSATANEYQNATIGRITRYTARASDGFTSVDYGTRRVLLGETPASGIPILHTSHGVGSLVFGTDGTLLASCGAGDSYASVDVGSAAETYYSRALTDGILKPKENIGAFRAQLVDSLSGKVLRIDPATGDGIPSNPFYDAANPRRAKSRVWAEGLRNPFRMALRPGTGSHLRSDGDPGVLYVGDVGWNEWEDLHVCTGPGMNFGWPSFEGIEAHPVYSTLNVQNPDAPNPLYPAAGCLPFFTFNQLLRQQTTVTANKPPFNNPCAAGQKIPGTIPQFLHSPPTLDWKHSVTQVRTWIPNAAGLATPINVGATGSPVSGTMFPGTCSIAGVWYTGTDFPAPYHNTYFHADYGANWIRNLTFDANDKPVSVREFLTDGAGIIGVATHPLDGGLYYLTQAVLKRITFQANGNRLPKAVATADKVFGTGPLLVQFNGQASIDPEGLPLAYDWDFGDGTAHGITANPSHVFNAAAGVATRYNVILKVTDNAAQVSTTPLIISVNNTPPRVTITSPVNGDRYSMTSDTVYNLRASVSDTESLDSQLQYEWRTILHHNNHEHPEPIDVRHATTSVISPAGCDGINVYYYRVELTVTDPSGLSTTTEVSIFPECGVTDTPPLISSLADQVVPQGQSSGPLLFTVSDAEAASFNLRVSGSSSNPELLPAENILFAESGASRTVTLHPVPGRAGEATVTLTVTDGPNSVSTRFLLTVPASEVEAVTVWQIGTDDNPLVAPYEPYREFSTEDGLNNARPGKVTRWLGDPLYAGAANPGADDDFYTVGTYPIGFNGLPAVLPVPNTEPPSAWERALTTGDRTNRVHFMLSSSQVTATTRLRLSFELARAGSSAGGTGTHDLVVRLRNGAGQTVSLFSQRITGNTNIVLEFPASTGGASVGPNTLEFVRTGPIIAGVSQWLLFDYLRLETLSTVAPLPLRSVWQVGTDDNPLILPYNPSAEFSIENHRNDPPPGRVTRLPGDPEHAGAGNPDRDDDFYFAGIYPAGFEGLGSELRVPNDEPAAAWERAHASDDRANRIHFVLDSSQVTATSRFRLSFELPVGGYTVAGVSQPSFGSHDLAVRFRNGFNLTVPLFSQRISQKTNLVLEFLASTAGATTGANTIEIERTGPTVAGNFYWLIYDYLRLEALPPSANPAVTVWQIGTDDNPLVAPYEPYREFSAENGLNNARPGKVTRWLGDPLYAGAANPGADDDFYALGTYPVGFNGLAAVLPVPNTEPPAAWERALTSADRTNRVHFMLSSSQVAATARLRLSFELAGGGSSAGGYGAHDLVVRLRNGAGQAVSLLSQRITGNTNIVLEFPASTAGASAGPNTIEFVRTGPIISGVSHWLLFDYLRLEAISGSGVSLAQIQPDGLSSPLSQAAGRSLASAGALLGSVRHQMISLDGLDYLALAYDQPDPTPEGVRYLIEASSDLLLWSEVSAVVLHRQTIPDGATVTVRDEVPLGSSQTRFLRLRVVPTEGGSDEARRRQSGQ